MSNLRSFAEQEFAIDISTVAEPKDDQDEDFGPSHDEGDQDEFVVDSGSYSVRYRGKECDLKNTNPFHVIARLNKSRGRFVNIRDLIDEVWGLDGADHSTVHTTVSKLRRKLEASQIEGVRIESDKECYRLVLVQVAAETIQ